MIIAKAHTFAANNIAYACEVNRNFDDLFALVNGNLDSANLATAFTVEASNVTINDTAATLCATTVEDAIVEVIAELCATNDPTSIYKGYNGIHITPFKTNPVVFHNGRIEIGGKECVIPSNISATGFLRADCATGYSGILAFVCSAVTTICASDIFLVDASNITDISSTVYANSNAGYYYGEKRAIGFVRGIGSGTIQSFVGVNGYDDYKSTPYVVSISGSDNLAFHGFTAIAVNVSATQGIYSVIRSYSPENRGYYYSVDGYFVSSTGTYRIAGGASAGIAGVDVGFQNLTGKLTCFNNTAATLAGHRNIETIPGVSIAYEYVASGGVYFVVTATTGWIEAAFGSVYHVNIDSFNIPPVAVRKI